MKIFMSSYEKNEKNMVFILIFLFLFGGMGSRRQLIGDSEKAIKDKI